MDKSPLTNYTRVCMNDLYTFVNILYPCISITGIRPSKNFINKLLIALDINRGNKKLPRSSNRGIVTLRRGLTPDFAETKTTLTKLLLNKILK